MNHVHKNTRARWNALEGLTVFTWSGSAVIGGYIIDAVGYRQCFFITSIIYCFGLALETVLIPLTSVMERRLKREKAQEALEEAQIDGDTLSTED
jgi:MFS family permease